MAREQIGTLGSGDGTDDAAAIAALTDRLTADESSLDEGPEVTDLQTRMTAAEDAISHKAAAIDLDNVFGIATNAQTEAENLDTRVDTLETSVGNIIDGDQRIAKVLDYEGTDPANVPVVKASGDARAAVWEFINDAASGYLFHLLLGPDAGHGAAAYAAGIDNDGIGLLVSNKKTGRGIVIAQNGTITDAGAYGLQVTQTSAIAPAVRLEAAVSGAAPVLQVLTVSAAAAGQILAYFGDPNGQAGNIHADTGIMNWWRDIVLHKKDGSTPTGLRFTEEDGHANPSDVYVTQNGVELNSYAGSSDGGGHAYYWKALIGHSAFSNHFTISGSDTYTPATTPTPALINAIDMIFTGGAAGIGFLGAAPVGKQTVDGTPQSLRNALALFGLVSTGTITTANLRLADGIYEKAPGDPDPTIPAGETGLILTVTP